MDEAFKTLRGKLEQGDWTTSARWVTEGAAERALDLIEASYAALLEELTQLRRVTQQVTEEPPPVKEDFQ